MPTYDYKCSACGHTFEQFQSITAPPIKRCPVCGKAKVKRLIGTGAGLIFKGSGFYITDYRDAAYKEKAKADSGGDSKAETKTDGKTETKSGGDSDSTSAPAPSGADPKPAPPKSEAKSGSKSEGKSSRKKQ